MRIDVYLHFNDKDESPVKVWSEEAETTDSVPAEAKVEEEGPAPAEEAPAPAKEEKPRLDESLRVEARKALADLNKRTGKNTAKEILKGLGFNSLKEVPLERIPEVMTIAREEEGDAE